MLDRLADMRNRFVASSKAGSSTDLTALSTLTLAKAHIVLVELEVGTILQFVIWTRGRWSGFSNSLAKERLLRLESRFILNRCRHGSLFLLRSDRLLLEITVLMSR